VGSVFFFNQLRALTAIEQWTELCGEVNERGFATHVRAEVCGVPGVWHHSRRISGFIPSSWDLWRKREAKVPFSRRDNYLRKDDTCGSAPAHPLSCTVSPEVTAAGVGKLWCLLWRQVPEWQREGAPWTQRWGRTGDKSGCICVQSV